MIYITFNGGIRMDRNEYGKLMREEDGTTWQEGHTLVILTAGACLFALVIALKNILGVPTDRLTMDLLFSMGVLGGLATSYPFVTKRRSASAISHPGLWIAAIVLITMAIIVMHATRFP
jgi:hypothetical protein